MGSRSWSKLPATIYPWIKDRIHLSYALNGARDHPEIESFIGHFKGENESLLLSASDLAERRLVVAEQMRYYNG